ncbi:DUF4150 domain-containing protein [Antarcticirhabdus aurantiaca]|uniref:DUF4150 domain-containing protein n=1 Tax=Antarcticirhabdus aurantiaca TaxID=2606717 RepID=A0ACD4NK25_9HYPH|nr:DUF4150 domain-containing protein [Antarcticirhabdus aurantiaca]WAJ27163.1 DUF4150 domain-containing protein [Jeongeuplla avenae]
MSLPPPREGSRDTREGLIISKFPDVCRSPQCPVPYTIVAYQSDDANTAASVRMTGQRAHKQNSIVTRCTGDEPGTGLGVKSNTVSSVCHRKEHSSTVRIEGQWATRHGDAWYMNNRNTIGKLNWYTGNKNFDPTPPLVAAAEMSAGSKVVMSDVSSSSPPLRPGTQLAFVDTSGQSIQPQTRTVLVCPLKSGPP